MKLYKRVPFEKDIKGFGELVLDCHKEATLSDIRAAAKEMGYALVPVGVANFYANEINYTSGDVPGHIYALDDSGGLMRASLAQENKE